MTRFVRKHSPLSPWAFVGVVAVWVLAFLVAALPLLSELPESIPGFFFALAVTLTVVSAMYSRRATERLTRLDGLIDMLASQERKQQMKIDEVARVWYGAGVMDALNGRDKVDDWVKQLIMERGSVATPTSGPQLGENQRGPLYGVRLDRGVVVLPRPSASDHDRAVISKLMREWRDEQDQRRPS